MRFLLAITFLLLTLPGISQKQNKLEGSWNVVGFGTKEMFFDLAKDTILTYQDFEHRKDLDSLQKDLVAGAPSGQFIFQSNGRFIQKSGTEVEAEGTYQIDTKKQQIQLIGKRNKIPIRETLQYRFRESTLYLTEISNEGDFTYKLVRSK